MNYQFIRDVTGSPIAEFEMGCESFSRWFTEELGSDQNKIIELVELVQKLQTDQIKHYVLQGAEYSLTLDPNEVEIRSNFLDADTLTELPEGTELYDQESISGCGLEDFNGVLLSWFDFVSTE